MDACRIPRTCLLAAVPALVALPGVQAHGGHAHVPGGQASGLVILIAGLAVIGAAVLLRRRDRLTTPARYGTTLLVGLSIAVLGGILLVQLTPIDELSGLDAPGFGPWYRPVALAAGAAVILGSLVAGRLRAPDKPHRAVTGALLGAWIVYPAVLPGFDGLVHPAGYLLAAATVAAVVWTLWIDTRPLLGAIRTDRGARRFGAAVAALMALFFAFSAGMLTVVPDEGVGLPAEGFVAPTAVADPLAMWPAISFWFPQIPLGGYVSVGTVLLVGLLAGLVGLAGAVTYRGWRSPGARTGVGAAAGPVAVAGPTACCCCGPMLAQVAVVLLGASAAAPIYWTFVDVASPLGSFFFVAAVGGLTLSLVRAVDAQGT